MYNIVLYEYGSSKNIKDLSEKCRISSDKLKELLIKANNVIKKNLDLKDDVLVLTSESIRAIRIAGVIKLSSTIELEIVPKYLGFNNINIRWKEDFYLLSMLSKYGKLLDYNQIHASTVSNSYLYELIGQFMAEEFILLKRKLIRQYRRQVFEDFAIDGEIHFENSFVKGFNGLIQEKVVFDSNNYYNATILAAMKFILPKIKSNKTKNILQKSIIELEPQNINKILKYKLKLPSRYLAWEKLYSLSFDLLNGKGAMINNGKILSPGFISSTWQIWQWLVSTSIKMGESNYKVYYEKKFSFGLKKSSGSEKNIQTNPDVAVIDSISKETVYLADAKYKQAIKDGKYNISRGDLYEAVSFCQSAKSDYLFLIYPNYKESMNEETVNILSEYEIFGKKIFIMHITVYDLVSFNGLKNFSDNILNCIRTKVLYEIKE